MIHCLIDDNLSTLNMWYKIKSVYIINNKVKQMDTYATYAKSTDTYSESVCEINKLK